MSMSFDDLDSGDISQLTGKGSESEAFGTKYARIKLGGGKFTLIDKDGNASPLVTVVPIKGKDVEVPDTDIDTYIVGVTPKFARTYYAGSFVPGKNDAPTCSSPDGIKPFSYIANPVSKSCLGCPMSAKGSAKSEDGTPKVACATKKHLVVVLDNNFDNPYMLTLAAGSSINFSDFIDKKNKSKFKDLALGYLKTKISLLSTDKNGAAISYARLGFSPIKVESEAAIIAEIKKYLSDGEKFELIQSMLGLNDTGPVREAQPQPTYTKVDKDLEVADLPEIAPKAKAKGTVDADIADFATADIPF